MQLISRRDKHLPINYERCPLVAASRAQLGKIGHQNPIMRRKAQGARCEAWGAGRKAQGAGCEERRAALSQVRLPRLDARRPIIRVYSITLGISQGRSSYFTMNCSLAGITAPVVQRIIGTGETASGSDPP